MINEFKRIITNNNTNEKWNYKEEVKDMIIYSDYTYNNFHTSK